MAARSAWGDNELRPSMAQVPRRLTEQELRADLKTDPEWERAYRVNAEFRVAAIEPGGFPAVGLVGQVKLGAPADVATFARPRETLIETTRLGQNRTGTQNDLRLELRESFDLRVVRSHDGVPGFGIHAPLPENAPFAERHLRQNQDVGGTGTKMADQVGPRAFQRRGFVRKLADSDSHGVS